MKLRFSVFLWAVLLSSGALWAEPGDLSVKITPQVIEPDRSVSWEQPLSKTVKAGNPVVVNINAEGLSIRVSVTPFARGADYLLVVQGEVRRKQGTGFHQSTSLQSLLVPSGETIAYFPLGRNPDGDDRQMVVFITVEPRVE